jgi:predicted  nucleic acid-binding Zn-ribbon protein
MTTTADAVTESTTAQTEVRKAVTDLDRTLDAASARAAELDAELHAITTEGRVDSILFRLKAAERRATHAEERAKEAEASAGRWMDHAIAMVKVQPEILEAGRELGRNEIRGAMVPPLTTRQRYLVILAGALGGLVTWGAADLVPHFIR